MYLYVLLLEDDKYYVGMAEDIGLRLWTHFNNKNKTGSAWTKKFKPLKVIHCSLCKGHLIYTFKNIEKQSTLRLAKLKGFAKVRGAGFSLSNAEYPSSWDEKLTNIPKANLNLMTPLSSDELNNLMKDKEDLWKTKKAEAIKKRKLNKK